MGMTFVWALELGRYGITVNAMAPAGATRMTAALYERSGKEPPPEENPALNAPLVAFLASEQAAHVNGQILGRTDFAYTIFQHPKQIAWMWKDGGWTRGGGRGELRRDARPAPPAGRHGDAQVDGEVTDRRPLRRRRRLRAAGRHRRERAARAGPASRTSTRWSAPIPPLALPIGCPTAFPKPVDTWCSTPAPSALDGPWERAVRWWRGAPGAPPSCLPVSGHRRPAAPAPRTCRPARDRPR